VNGSEEALKHYFAVGMLDETVASVIAFPHAPVMRISGTSASACGA